MRPLSVLIPFAAWLACALPPLPAAAQDLAPLGGIAQLSTGLGHACAVTATGAAKCWGRNDAGQVGDIAPGDNVFGNRVTAVDVAGLDTGVAAVAAGGAHSCALSTGGGVKCWGDNFYGQLGDASLQRRTAPVAVTGLAGGVAAITAGDRHTCALTTGGGVKCWGDGSDGQLGTGNTSSSNVPVDVPGLASGVAMVSAGGAHTCIVTTTGAARCWGRNDAGQVGDGTLVGKSSPTNVSGLASGVAKISAGGEFTCVVTTGGGARCWGRNVLGQLGDGTNTQRSTSVAVSGLASGVTQLDAGNNHACTRSGDGSARCWGWNVSGQVGNGGASNFTLVTATPSLVSGLASGVSAIAAGEGFTCALLADGGVKCWGDSHWGSLGDGTLGTRAAPADVAGLGSGATVVAAGYEFTCAVAGGGRAVCWGNNGQGQLGNGNTTASPAPLDVATLGSGVATLSVGMGTGGHACALTTGGGLKCWGSNAGGRLGDGSFSDRSTPVGVVNLASGVASVSAGGFHTCAVTLGGGAKCWGGNFEGGVGDGTLASRPTPVDVSGLTSGVAQVTTGYYHSCARTTVGGVKCWGDNGHGQLGNGNTTDSPVPVDVTGLASGVVTVSAGQGFTCAVLSSGEVRCWGENAIGLLGGSTGPDQLVPATVAGLAPGIVAIDASNFHVCAASASGAVQCWGANFNGALGDGSTNSRSAPVVVAGFSSGIAGIATGGDHTCARTSGGAVRCWGLDAMGQLGDGGRNYLLPAPVMVDSLASRIASDGDGASYGAGSDASGRYVVFESPASQFGDTLDLDGKADIFRRDLKTGTLARVSVDDAGTDIAAAAMEPTISADGSQVAFVTLDAAVDKVRGESAKARATRMKAGTFGVYLRNLVVNSTSRMSMVVPARASGAGTKPMLAPTGKALVYTGQVNDPAMGLPGPQIIHVPISYDGNGDPVPGAPRCVSCKSVAAGGTDSAINADGASVNPVLSADGEWVAYETEAKNLIAGVPSPCPAGGSEIMLRNLITGISQRVSPPPTVANCGAAGAGSHKPSLDWSGRKIVYESDQSPTPGDGDASSDVFLYDAGQGQTVRVSQSLGTNLDGNGDSVQPAISGDGNVISFRSAARNLESREPDNNETEDIYVRRLDRPMLRRISRNRRGDQANQTSRSPALNYNGTQVAFDTDATNLSLGGDNQLLDGNGAADVYQSNNPTTAEVVFRSGF